MLYEVVSTHAAHGLFKGHTGFCPVAVTRETPKAIVKLMADLGRHQVSTWSESPEFAQRASYHLPFSVEGRPYHVVARAVHQGRNDDGSVRWLLHQVILDNVGSISGGPAWLLGQEAVWLSHWQLSPQYLEPRTIESEIVSPRVCETWREVTGDAGWAGVAIEAAQKGKTFALIVPPNAQPTMVNQLLAEAQSLLDPKVRWEIPLAQSTWIPPKLAARRWAAYATGTQDAVTAARHSDTLLVDISRKLGPAANVFSEIARSGDWARLDSHRRGTPGGGAGGTIPATHGPASQVNASDFSALDYQLFGGDDSALIELPATAGTPVVLPPTPLRPSFWQRSSFPWMKWTIAVGLLLLGAFTIWQGFQFLHTVLRVAKSEELANSKSRPADRNRPALPDAGKNDVGTQLDSTTSAANPEGTGSEAGKPADSGPQPTLSRVAGGGEPPRVTPAAGRAIFNQVETAYPVVALPAGDAADETVLITIPIDEILLPQLGVGLATTRQWVDAVDPRRGLENEGEDPPDHPLRFAVEIAERAGGSPATAVAAFRCPQAEGGPQTQVVWRWDKPPSPELQAELQLGALVLWLRQYPNVRICLPLEPPAKVAPLQPLRGLLENVELSPPRGADVAHADFASAITWIPRMTGYSTAGDESARPVGEERWLPPQTAGNPSNYFVLDPERLTTQLLTTVAGDAPAEEGLRSTCERMIEKMAPIQVDLRWDELSRPQPGQETIAWRVRAILHLRTADGSRSSIIFQTNPQEPRPPKRQEFQEKVESDLRRWLARGLDLPDSLAPTFIAGGYQGKRIDQLRKLDRSDAQLRTALAQMLTDDLMELLQRELSIRIDRATRLILPDGEAAVEIPALIGE